MANDPAINWYFDNWDGGTKLMTRHQKGCYMDLLSAQFHNGPLSLENIKTVLGADFQASWPVLSKKFTEADGLFFNDRLEAERKKRVAYSESRSKNRRGAKNDHMSNISSSYVDHMKNIPGIETGTENEKQDEGYGEKGTPMTIPDKITELKASDAWHEQTSKACRTTTDQVVRLLDDFILEMQAKDDLDRPFSDLKRHFVSWLRLRLKEQPKGTQQKTGMSGKNYNAGLK